MADINSIQEEQAPDTEPKASLASKLQGVLAPMQGLLDKIAAIDHPLVQKFKQNKVLLYSVLGGTALLIVLLLLLLILALMPSKSTKSPKQTPQESVSNEISQEEVHKLLATPLPAPDDEAQDSSVDNLIIKGNVLYDQGYRQEAYEVFRKIADFSQSIANYNLGTMELKSQLYHNAIAAYNESIQTGQNISASAINAAVAAFKIDRFDLYGHYVKVANDNLSEIINEPFYSYAYALPPPAMRINILRP